MFCFTNCSKYFQAMSVTDVDAVNVELASAFYRKCFRDPSLFTLVLVGNFSREALPALLERYLAAIPLPPKEAEAVDKHGIKALPRVRDDVKVIDINFPKQRVVETVTKWMVDPLCCTQMTFPLRIEASLTLAM